MPPHGGQRQEQLQAAFCCHTAFCHLLQEGHLASKPVASFLMSDTILHWHSLPGSIVPLKVQEDKSAKRQTDSSCPVHGVGQGC